MFKAAVFDMDGTLIDSVTQHAAAWQDAFRDFGHEVSFDELRRLIGKGSDQLLSRFLTRTDVEGLGKALEEHRSKMMRDRYLPTVQAFADVRALLERLRADGVIVALASSAQKDELQTYKRIADVADLVEFETSSDDAERSKPCPDIFQAVLAKMTGVEPEHAVVIGDTPYDVEAATKAGMRTIGLSSGGWSAGELEQAGCIAVYRDPADLFARFDHSPFAEIEKPDRTPVEPPSRGWRRRGWRSQ